MFMKQQQQKNKINDQNWTKREGTLNQKHEQ